VKKGGTRKSQTCRQGKATSKKNRNPYEKGHTGRGKQKKKSDNRRSRQDPIEYEYEAEGSTPSLAQRKKRAWSGFRGKKFTRIRKERRHSRGRSTPHSAEIWFRGTNLKGEGVENERSSEKPSHRKLGRIK